MITDDGWCLRMTGDVVQGHCVPGCTSRSTSRVMRGPVTCDTYSNCTTRCTIASWASACGFGRETPRTSRGCARWHGRQWPSRQSSLASPSRTWALQRSTARWIAATRSPRQMQPSLPSLDRAGNAQTLGSSSRTGQGNGDGPPSSISCG
jgi:hypothetical protein